MARVAEPNDTSGRDYAERLARLASARWKRWLDVQAPYRWNLRRLRLGRTLEVGCGIGRNLAHLPPGSAGIDPNPHAVAAARRRGLAAFEPDAFRVSPFASERFDAVLFAHVLEHLRPAAAEALVAEHLAFLRDGGRVVLITPQEAGFRSDPTHVAFLDLAALRALLARLGCEIERGYSFPFPRALGPLFRHNEFVAVGRRS
jgi:SAM-dependent methyltransferase